MALFKLIAQTNADAASNTSLSSAFAVPGDFSHYAIKIPTTTVFTTTTCGIQILGSDSATGTYYKVGYANSPTTSTTGFVPWTSAGSCTVQGAMVICEALQFVPGFAKLNFTQVATGVVTFSIYGRKFD